MDPWRNAWRPVGTQLVAHEGTQLMYGASDPALQKLVRENFLEKIAEMPNFKDDQYLAFKSILNSADFRIIKSAIIE